MSRTGALLLFILLAPLNAAAQGNINHGRQLAEDHHCASCHSAENPYAGAVPYIEGQKIYYLAKQLRAFRDSPPPIPDSPLTTNERRHPVMTWESNRLSDTDVRDLAEYYASLPCRPVRSTANSPVVTQPKYQRCTYCHGPIGNSPYDIVPNLGGQKRQYLLDELLKLRTSALEKPLEPDHERFSRMMAPAVYDLTDLEIAGMANFYSQQSCKESP